MTTHAFKRHTQCTHDAEVEAIEMDALKKARIEHWEPDHVCDEECLLWEEEDLMEDELEE